MIDTNLLVTEVFIWYRLESTVMLPPFNILPTKRHMSLDPDAFYIFRLIFRISFSRISGKDVELHYDWEAR